MYIYKIFQYEILDYQPYGNPPDKIKWEFFKVVAMLVQLYSFTPWTHLEKKLDENCTTRMLHARSSTLQVAVVWLLTYYHTNHSSKICWALLEKKRTNL